MTGDYNTVKKSRPFFKYNEYCKTENTEHPVGNKTNDKII